MDYFAGTPDTRSVIMLKFTSMKSALLLLLGPVLLLSATMRYQVSFLGISVVNVEVSDSIDSQTGIVTLVYHPKTAPWIPDKYFVDNLYTFSVKPDLSGIISYQKSINQFNLKQQFYEQITDSTITYSTGQILPLNVPVHHMLSLIAVLQFNNNTLPDTVFMELEGKLFTCSRLAVKNDDFPGQNAYEIILAYRGGRAVLEKTDYFTVELDNPAARRFIGYSKQDGRIMNAKFIFGKISLIARRID